jgi:hypothetical protein
MAAAFASDSLHCELSVPQTEAVQFLRPNPPHRRRMLPDTAPWALRSSQEVTSCYHGRKNAIGHSGSNGEEGDRNGEERDRAEQKDKVPAVEAGLTLLRLRNCRESA